MLNPEHDKFESRSVPGIFVGYGGSGSILVLLQNEYVCSPRCIKIITSKDFQADLSIFPFREIHKDDVREDLQFYIADANTEVVLETPELLFC